MQILLKVNTNALFIYFIYIIINYYLKESAIGANNIAKYLTTETVKAIFWFRKLYFCCYISQEVKY